jgi:hypothetical protein
LISVKFWQERRKRRRAADAREQPQSWLSRQRMDVPLFARLWLNEGCRKVIGPATEGPIDFKCLC